MGSCNASYSGTALQSCLYLISRVFTQYPHITRTAVHEIAKEKSSTPYRQLWSVGSSENYDHIDCIPKYIGSRHISLSEIHSIFYTELVLFQGLNIVL